MKVHRASQVTAGLFACAALLPIGPMVAAPTAAAAVTDVIARPATVLSISPLETDMRDKFQGAVCQPPNACRAVIYPAFITASGVPALQNAIVAALAAQPAPEHVIVFGYSNGAMVSEQWLKKYLKDPKRPPSDVLSFVVMGNPTRAGSGSGALHGEVWPTSDYKVLDVARQYDGPADFPNNPASPYYRLAIRNAHAGFVGGMHDYTNVNLNDPRNAVWTSPDGNITYVLVPTEYVPILGPLAPMMPAQNAKLKAQIETAYIRPVPFPTPTQSASQAASPAAAGSALSASVVSNPTVAAPHNTVSLSVAPAPNSATPAGGNAGEPEAETVTTTSPADTADAAQTTTSSAAQPGTENSIGSTGPASNPTPDTHGVTNTEANEPRAKSQESGSRPAKRFSLGQNLRRGDSGRTARSARGSGAAKSGAANSSDG